MPMLYIYNPDGTAQAVPSLGPQWTLGELKFWLGDDFHAEDDDDEHEPRRPH